MAGRVGWRSGQWGEIAMKAAIFGTVAGVCLGLVLVGCSPNELVQGTALIEQLGNGDQVMAGSLNVVAQSEQARLTAMGLKVQRTQQDGAIYLTSMWRDGTRFALVLTQANDYQGREKTKVHLEMQGSPNDQVSFQIMARSQK
jgi:hypothetical protein